MQRTCQVTQPWPTEKRRARCRPLQRNELEETQIVEQCAAQLWPVQPSANRVQHMPRLWAGAGKASGR